MWWVFAGLHLIIVVFCVSTIVLWTNRLQFLQIGHFKACIYMIKPVYRLIKCPNMRSGCCFKDLVFENSCFQKDTYFWNASCQNLLFCAFKIHFYQMWLSKIWFPGWGILQQKQLSAMRLCYNTVIKPKNVVYSGNGQHCNNWRILKCNHKLCYC